MPVKTIYSGEALKEGIQFANTKLMPYLPSSDLQKAVNLAYFLGRPLLLMGEPGCGKTRVAEAVAYEIHGENFKENYFRWNVKSSTKARDGLYQYDALKHLREVQMSRLTDDKTKWTTQYIRDEFFHIGEMGKAFLKTHKLSKDKPPILLIDEVDKADIDFPNDLLVEIENSSFEIQEAGVDDHISAAFAPLTIITSNREKELPPAFLRRCVFYYIEFPKIEELKSIIQANFTAAPPQLTAEALAVFMRLRTKLETQFAGLEKNVSTSELLDWFKILLEENTDPASLSAVKDQLDNNAKAPIPYPSVLMKNWDAMSLLIN
jgi:MoxR-like ATPase